jgi:PhoPQ-activated pathogenicity-related protein
MIIRIIRIYKANKIIVVLCKSHVAAAAGEITDAVIDYLYESDEQPVSYSSL